jgi:hypothetical protein
MGRQQQARQLEMLGVVAFHYLLHFFLIGNFGHQVSLTFMRKCAR